MTEHVNSEIRDIIKKVEDSRFEIYLVGGCVRNLLMGIPVKDWDLTTNATPEDIQTLFPQSFYENTFGTVGIPVLLNGEQESIAEITTYRKESNYENLRHPSSIEWGKTLFDDLSRRDFTVNAIALRFTPTPNNPENFELIDPYHGKEDISKRIIRTVGNPDERFSEDALRLMRAVRFATQLNFEIEHETWNSIVKNAANITRISFERIRDELFKILASDRPYDGVVLLDQSGMLDHIIPELSKGKGISQKRPGRHHTDDVFTHNLLALKHTPANDPLVRFATLLHDIGKPDVVGQDEDGHITFYNHEVTGAHTASAIADRLKLSRKQREKIFTLVRWHMFSIDEEITDHAIRKFIRRVGVENVQDMIDLRIGDRLGSGTQTAESWRLKRFKEMIQKELNPPFSINDLAIDGNDIMRELDMKPGPAIGTILHQLFEEVDEDLTKNTHDFLINRIHEINNQ